jgi:sugar lactone lactonase YvrE
MITASGGVRTLAGSGTAGFLNAPGTSAQFNNPTGVAIDNATGNLYVADKFNHVIRKITPTGDVSTLAGIPGFPGSTEGPGTTAQFNLPSGVAVDASGNILVADAGNHKIRRITPAGFVSLVAGTGNSGSGEGPGAFAQFNSPSGVAADPNGNIYVADAGNNKIRKISGGLVSTLAGGGANGVTPGFANGSGTSALFNLPTGVVADAAGNVYVSDKFNHAIRQITPSGVVATLSGNGTAGFVDGLPAASRFNSPAGIAIDVSGNLFIAEEGNQRIREIGTLVAVTSLAGNGLRGFADGPGSTAQFDYPRNLAVDASGNIIVAEGHRIRKITPAGDVSTLAGTGIGGYSGDGGPATSANLNAPQDVAIDGSGNIFVADFLNNVIRRITPAGVISTWAGIGSAGFRDGASAMFNGPRGVAVDASGNVYVADDKNHAIRKITPDHSVITLAGNGFPGFADNQGTAAQFDKPADVAVDAVGNLYVADYNNQRIRKITPSGNVSTLAGNSLRGAIDGQGSSAQFNFPGGVTLDATGNVYVADGENYRIRKITSTGVVTTVTGSKLDYNNGPLNIAQFRWPGGVAIDASGILYVADFGNQRIRKIQ